MSYLSPAQYKLRSVLNLSRIEAIEIAAPGWLEQELSAWSKRMDVMLAKRYAVPFDSPDGPPEVVQQWLQRIVDVRCMLKAGVDQQDEQFQEIKEDSREARDEIKQAAESEHGLFELPLKAGSATTAISRGNTFVYSESSPYAWTDVQADRGRSEDQNGGGSFG